MKNPEYQNDFATDLYQDVDDMTALARYFDTLSHENKIAFLTGKLQGLPRQDIAEKVDVASPTLEGHAKKLQNNFMVYQPEHGEWVVTPVGQHAVENGPKNLDGVIEAYNILTDTHDDIFREATADLTDSGEGLTPEEFEKLDEEDYSLPVEFEELDDDNYSLPVDDSQIYRNTHQELWEEDGRWYEVAWMLGLDDLHHEP